MTIVAHVFALPVSAFVSACAAIATIGAMALPIVTIHRRIEIDVLGTRDIPPPIVSTFSVVSLAVAALEAPPPLMQHAIGIPVRSMSGLRYLTPMALVFWVGLVVVPVVRAVAVFVTAVLHTWPCARCVSASHHPLVRLRRVGVVLGLVWPWDYLDVLLLGVVLLAARLEPLVSAMSSGYLTSTVDVHPVRHWGSVSMCVVCGTAGWCVCVWRFCWCMCRSGWRADRVLWVCGVVRGRVPVSSCTAFTCAWSLSSVSPMHTPSIRLYAPSNAWRMVGE